RSARSERPDRGARWSGGMEYGARRCGSGAPLCANVGWQWVGLAPGARWLGWRPEPEPPPSGQWEGHWARSHWAPNQFYGFWGPPEAWGVPYIGWGVPYVPYRYYGDWGALWYPYAEWRGPHRGWGNP